MSIAWLIKNQYITTEQAEALEPQEKRNLATHGIADLINSGAISLERAKHLPELEREKLHIYSMLNFRSESITLEQAVNLTESEVDNLYNLGIISLINNGFIDLQTALSLSKEKVEILSSMLVVDLIKKGHIKLENAINLTKEDIDWLMVAEQQHSIISEYCDEISPFESSKPVRVAWCEFEEQLENLKLINYDQNINVAPYLGFLRLFQFVTYRIGDYIRLGFFSFKEDNLEQLKVTQEQREKLCSFRLFDWIDIEEIIKEFKFDGKSVISYRDAINLNAQQIKNLTSLRYTLAILINSGCMTFEDALNLTEAQRKILFTCEKSDLYDLTRLSRSDCMAAINSISEKIEERMVKMINRITSIELQKIPQLSATKINYLRISKIFKLIEIGLISIEDTVKLIKDNDEANFHFLKDEKWINNKQIQILVSQKFIELIKNGDITLQEGIQLVHNIPQDILLSEGFIELIKNCDITLQKVIQLIQSISKDILYLTSIKVLSWQQVINLTEKQIEKILEEPILKLLKAKQINWTEALSLTTQKANQLSIDFTMQKMKQREIKKSLDELMQLGYITSQDINKFTEKQKEILSNFCISDLIKKKCLTSQEAVELTDHQIEKLSSSLLLGKISKNKEGVSNYLKTLSLQTSSPSSLLFGSSLLSLSDSREITTEKIIEIDARLLPEGLKLVHMPRDGNCFYSAVSLYLNEKETTLRNIVAGYLENNINEYRQFIVLTPETTVEEYIQDIRTKNEWAGDLEITILSKLLDRHIITIGPDGKITNKQVLDEPRNGEPIFVYYNNINHYDALILKEAEYSARDILNTLLQKEPQAQSVKMDTSVSSSQVDSLSSTQTGCRLRM